MGILDLILHRHIRTGDRVRVYWSDTSQFDDCAVTVEGWGKYAPVKIGNGPGYVRRDCIRKEGKNWVYRYDE